MWNNKKSTYRRHLSVILLLLIAVRVVPFGLLHYHNGYFASFEAGASIPPSFENNADSQVKDSSGPCSIHQLIDLINNGFQLGTTLQIINVAIYKDNINLYTEDRLEIISVYILNKGSPIPA